MDISVIQSGVDTLVLTASGAPSLDIVFDDELVETVRKGAAFVILAAIIIVLGKAILPGGRGANPMMGGGGGNGGKIVMFIAAAIVAMDINVSVNVANFLLSQLWALQNMIFG